MIKIDGSYGEGGGQILRSSLALSMVTGKAFGIEKIRAGRKKTGLLRQHLTAAKAAAEICGAQLEGAFIGSGDLVFIPGKIKGGEYRFAVGTAGSGTLVLQTVLPALIMADKASEIIIEGGTHNPYSPPYDFLKKVFLPFLGKMGCKVEAEIEKYGFYPAGGGVFKVRVEPAMRLEKLEVLERGAIIKRKVRGIASQIPLNIAESEVGMVLKAFSWDKDCGLAEEVPSPGPGNAVMIELESENVSELFTGFGEVGVPMKKVAHNAVQQVQRYLASGVPVGRFLADQLLLLFAIAGGGRYRTLAPSNHTLTNISVIKNFLAVDVRCEELSRDVWEIEIKS